MEILTPDWPAPVTVQSAISTRIGGFSTKPWGSLNLAFHVGDDSLRVEENWAQLTRQLLTKQLEIPPSPQLLNQVHGTDLVEALHEGLVPTADGCFSHKRGRACVVMTADCLPILLCNTAGTEVAAVHAGWRGLAAGIVSHAMSCFSSPPNQLMAYLGPAISQKYFEVGAEVRQAFLTDCFRRNSKSKVTNCFSKVKSNFHEGGPHVDNSADKWMADLYGLARIALNEAGVDQIYGGDFCTYEDTRRFYSYRRDGQTGRMASLIWIS